jgi:hypothetical protein
MFPSHRTHCHAELRPRNAERETTLLFARATSPQFVGQSSSIFIKVEYENKICEGNRQQKASQKDSIRPVGNEIQFCIVNATVYSYIGTKRRLFPATNCAFKTKAASSYLCWKIRLSATWFPMPFRKQYGVGRNPLVIFPEHISWL